MNSACCLNFERARLGEYDRQPPNDWDGKLKTGCHPLVTLSAAFWAFGLRATADTLASVPQCRSRPVGLFGHDPLTGWRAKCALTEAPFHAAFV
jgi:hypothetical protein